MNTVTRAKVVEIHEGVKAALTNEQITRQRVERLEEAVERHSAFLFNDENIYKKLSRPFWGRMKWLLFGK